MVEVLRWRADRVYLGGYLVVTHRNDCQLLGTTLENHFGWCPLTEDDYQDYFTAWSYAMAWGKDVYMLLSSRRRRLDAEDREG